MYLFSRTAVLGGGLTASMSWAADITNHINDKHDIGLSLWGVSQGAPVGTVGWTAMFESHAAQADAGAAIQADPEYLRLVDEGQEFMLPGSGQDALRQILDGGPGDTPAQVAILTTGQAGNGKIVQAIEFGIETNQYLSSLTGLESAFLVDAYGAFGQVTWIQGFPDMAAVDAALETINSDPGYMERVTNAGALFVEGTGHRSLGARIL